MPRILSVDLASRRYRDNGIAVLDGAPGRVRCRLVAPAALGLDGAPEATRFADALAELATQEEATLILLDGPQGWRAERSALVHQRHCERATLTPGKTGTPGIVKPATWTRMAEFSIAVFDTLATHGWPRITDGWHGQPASIESFPTQAWRSLGLSPLPGKSNARDLGPWITALQTLGVREIPAAVSHDELQAVVAGLAGVQLLDGGWNAADARGCNPVRERQHWREGWIISPRR